MTAEKVIEVLDLYETLPGPSKALEMLPRVREFVAADEMGKAFRWLGFMQGMLWCEGVYTIDEMRAQNRM